MKSIRSHLAFFIIAASLSVPQQVSASDEPLAQKGSWQVVANKRQKKISVVQFYNHRKELIYEEKLEGVKLNLRDNQTVLLLNELLLKAMSFRNDNKANLETKLVSQALKNQRKKTTS